MLTAALPLLIRATMTAPLPTLRKRSHSTLIMLWPTITAPWPSFFSRTTPKPGRMSNVSSRPVASPIRNSSGISARPQAGKGEAVWYRGVIHTMAIEPTQDSVHRLEHLLLTREIEEFLYAEAALLDERRFEDWLALLTDDIRYWMPMRRNVKFGEHERENTRERQDMNWFDEGKTTLQQRVQQIMTGVHWAEEPLSRVCHMVTNVQIVQATATEVTVQSRFLVYRNRLQDETDFFIGKREDVLRKVDGAWKIARRHIMLDQNVLLAKNLTVFF